MMRSAGGPGFATPQDMGDPGIFGWLGSAVKRGAGIALGSLPGGGAIKTIGGAVLGGGGLGGRPPAAPPGFGGFGAGPSGGSTAMTPVSGTNRYGPGFVVRASTQPGVPATEVGIAGGCPRGMRPNKSGYYRRVPGTNQVVYVPPKHICVKNRRRNPLNPRALDRSMSRLESAGKALKRLGFKAPKATAIAQKGKKRGRR